MKPSKETLLTIATLVLMMAPLAYKNWDKSHQISELEATIELHKMYSSREELKSNYIREKIAKTNKFRTMNDSLQILYVADDMVQDNSGTYMEFKVTAINKLNKEIKVISGCLTLKDSSKIVATFPVEISPKFIPNSDTTYWRQSWNLDRYVARIKDVLKAVDLKTIKLEWKTNSVLFADNSAIILNESGR